MFGDSANGAYKTLDAITATTATIYTIVGLLPTVKLLIMLVCIYT